MDTILCPSQQQAFDLLGHELSLGHILTLGGGTGLGRTTVLRKLHARIGGAFLGAPEWTERLGRQHPLALEEAFEQMVLEALRDHDVVIVDDLHLVTCVVGGCNWAYPRKGLLDAALTTLT